LNRPSRRSNLALFIALSVTSSGAQAMCDLQDAGDGEVLSLDVVDAQKSRTPPLITIFADGKMAVRAPPPSTRTLMARMSRTDLKALVTYVTHTEHFTEIESAAIAAALEAPAPGQSGLFLNRVADAPNSFLTLALPGCSHSVTVEGSAVRSNIRKDIDALQRFRRIEVRLLELVAKVQPGT
jgi:hypothetical protein